MTSRDDMPGDYLTYRDLSQWLGVPEGTLRNWRYRGVGPPATTLVGLVRFHRADVEEWLKAQRDTHQPPPAAPKNHRR